MDELGIDSDGVLSETERAKAVIENGKSLLRAEFCKRYLEWREAAESPLARYKVVELAWVRYCDAREAYLFNKFN